MQMLLENGPSSTPILLSREDIEQVTGSASASYNTPGDPDYGNVPYSSGNKGERLD